MTQDRQDAPQPVRVALIEDDARFCDEVEATLAQTSDLRLAARAPDLRRARRMLAGTAVDVVLLNLDLPDGDGITLIPAIRQCWPACEVIVSTVIEEEARVLAAIQAGATGYLLKQTSLDELAAQIRTVHAGGSLISPRIARRLLEHFRATHTSADAVGSTAPAHTTEPGEAAEGDSRPIRLSLREREVLEHVTQGFTAQGIGVQMGLSHWTIQTYIRRIYEKLGARNRAEAVNRAHQLGLAAQRPSAG
ncbi:MAG: response regulator transcription factor [Comamonas sp.]